MTSTRRPSRLPARCAEWSATDSGSDIAISASDTSVSTGTHCAAGIVKNSRNRPCMCGNTLALPRKRMFEHRFSRPSRQPAQRPQGRDGLIATRSPGRSPVTPAPVSTTTPDASWPGTSGSRITKAPTRPWK